MRHTPHAILLFISSHPPHLTTSQPGNTLGSGNTLLLSDWDQFASFPRPTATGYWPLRRAFSPNVSYVNLLVCRRRSIGGDHFRSSDFGKKEDFTYKSVIQLVSFCLEEAGIWHLLSLSPICPFIEDLMGDSFPFVGQLFVIQSFYTLLFFFYHFLLLLCP